MAGIDLAGETLGSGVYKRSPTTINLTGILTLNGKDIYIFQVGTSIITGANFQLLAINEATAGCVFWLVGSSFTFGASSQFLGNIFAYAFLMFWYNVTHSGSIYALTAAFTFITDTVTGQDSCNICNTIIDLVKSR
ncbi:unnamed protein product, partial [Rotaria magnacalcarata]